MKKLLITTALFTALSFTGAAQAHEGEQGGGHMWAMHDALAQLPPEDAAKFKAAYHANHEKMHALHEKLHTLYHDLYGITTADNFDKHAFIAKSHEMEKLKQQMHGLKTESMANALAQLPQDERTELADAMKKAHHMHHPMHDGQHWDHTDHHADDPAADEGQKPQDQ